MSTEGHMRHAINVSIPSVYSRRHIIVVISKVYSAESGKKFLKNIRQSQSILNFTKFL